MVWNDLVRQPLERFVRDRHGRRGPDRPGLVAPGNSWTDRTRIVGDEHGMAGMECLRMVRPGPARQQMKWLGRLGSDCLGWSRPSGKLQDTHRNRPDEHGMAGCAQLALAATGFTGPDKASTDTDEHGMAGADRHLSDCHQAGASTRRWDRQGKYTETQARIAMSRSGVNLAQPHANGTGSASTRQAATGMSRPSSAELRRVRTGSAGKQIDEHGMAGTDVFSLNNKDNYNGSKEEEEEGRSNRSSP